MNWKSFRASAWPLPVLLAMTRFPVACQSIQSTLTGTDKAEQADAILSTGVSSAWPAVTYSSRDTGETQTQARATNAARKAYCDGVPCVQTLLLKASNPPIQM